MESGLFGIGIGIGVIGTGIGFGFGFGFGFGNWTLALNSAILLKALASLAIRQYSSAQVAMTGWNFHSSGKVDLIVP